MIAERVKVIPIRRGLKLPIAGPPVQDIKFGPRPTQVALIGEDFHGIKPAVLVQVGDAVRLGQALISDKRFPQVVHTSPVSGVVSAIHRGEKRRLLSVVIDIEQGGAESFPAFENLRNLTAESARELLLQSGLWTSLRTRPFNYTPAPDAEPHSIFVTAIDTNPLAAEPELVIAQRGEEFVSGLMVVSKLTRGKTFVCTRDDSRVPGHDVPGVEFFAFDGPHPAGLPGTHIHFLDPVGPKKTVWFLNYQDVIAIGHLFRTGKLDAERVISIAGPRVRAPGLYRVPLGSNVLQLVADLADLKNARVVCGSVLYGRIATPPVQFLGRFHMQVSVLEEGTRREFLGWQMPGFDKFSVTKIYAGSWFPSKLFSMNTNLNGSKRAMVPVGTYERVMPLDLLPTPLLRSLICHDTENAQALGCLELDEEDVALCTYVCPGKYDYGELLRQNLTKIEKDG